MPVTVTQLDMSRLTAHLRKAHKNQKNLPRAVLARAREHAAWHRFKGQGHGHGGPVVSLVITEGRFSVHGEGFFTGQHVDEREEWAIDPR
jgi:hypothetical protein